MTVKKDFYAMLEVGPRARPEVVKAAYVALMKLYHPDSGTDKDPEKAKRINEAWEVLSDPQARADFDRQGAKKEHLVGNYRVLEEIAEGGFGKTYRGEHVILGEPVCIKQCSNISPQSTAILLDEARAIWDLRHFAIPAMRDLVKLDDGSLALVMSFVPGKTLAKIIEITHKIDPESLCWIVERALNGLKYLHYHGVIHGDVKPQNLIVQDKDHTVVWVDFGLSLVKPTSKDVSKGYTRYFASPESLANLPLVPESDFYSLGLTMIYALTGDIESVKLRRVPPKTPDPLFEFIKRLTAKDVSKRPRWKDQDGDGGEDLCQTIVEVRRQSFNRTQSGMKPIPGL